jgi:hypothetical protein
VDPLAGLEVVAADGASLEAFERADSAAAEGVDIAPDLRSESGVDAGVQRLVLIEGADEPAQRTVALRGQTELLGEGRDVVRLGLVGEVGAGEIDILEGDVGLVAICRDRGEVGEAGVPVDLGRDALADQFVRGIDIEDDVAIEARRRIADGAEAQGRNGAGGGAVLQLDGAAADLVDLVVVGDDADREVLAGLPQQVAADRPAVAVVDVVAGGQIGA